MENTKINPRIIENVMQELSLTEVRRLSEDEINLLLGLIVVRDDVEKQEDMFDKLVKKGAWELQAIDRRRNALDVEFDKATLVFVYGISKTIGIAILYLYYMQWWANKNNVKRITIGVVSSRVFPLGVFTEESLINAWEAQKKKRDSATDLGSDNWIDYAAASQSIMLNT